MVNKQGRQKKCVKIFLNFTNLHKTQPGQKTAGLSKLNFHKFKHNFSNTLNPLCPINDGIEDTEHFLLLCHAYDQERRDLLNSVNAILRPHGLTNLTNETLLQILLYGHEKLSFDLNTKILEATLNYIHASERFQ